MQKPPVTGWRRLLPPPFGASWRERLYASSGAFLGLFCTEWIARQALHDIEPYFIAPMGASTVLLFAAPTTPMAQPFPMLAGNVVSASIGVACAHWLGATPLAAALAAALAIAVMFLLRCLHPPGGAMAVTAVIGGPAIQTLGWQFVAGPVLVNSLVLLVIALLFNDLLQRRYLLRSASAPNPHRTSDPLPSQRVGFNIDDLDAVLAARGEVLDISKHDLEAILVAAELHAYSRRFGEVRCEDIMSKDVVVINENSRASEAWGKLAKHKIKALPVVNDAQCLSGIISLHDFFIGHDNTPLPLPEASERQQKTVFQLMTDQVASVQPQQPITDLVKLFSDVGLHHVPVIDSQRHVLGMITQSDLVAAMFATTVFSTTA